MKYCLYVNYECIGEYDTFEEAQENFNKCYEEDPESVIDVLSEDGEISYLGVN